MPAYKTVKLIQYGKFRDTKAEEIPRNKLFVYLIGNNNINRKGENKGLILKAVIVTNPIAGWFKTK